MAKDVQFTFRISQTLLDVVRKHTSNISGYIRSLIEDDLGKHAETRDYPKTPYVYHASLVDVVDGDTIKVEMDVGFELTLNVVVRLENINAPEINTAAGKRARDFIAKKLKGAHLVIETKKRGKFGRYIAKVYYHRTRSDYREILQYGSLINDDMIQARHAKTSS